MNWSAMHLPAAWHAQHKRRRRSPQIVRLRDHVADLVHGAADEVHELKFCDGTHAGQRSAESCSHDGRLGNRRIYYALGTEAVNEAVGDLERSAVDADVFTQTEDARVTLHLLPDALADGFEISELWHDGKVYYFQNSRMQAGRSLSCVCAFTVCQLYS